MSTAATHINQQASQLQAQMAASTRDQLIAENMQQVSYIARQIHGRLPQHVSLDDLESAGILGLLDACDKFDSGKDVQFKTYAQFRIRGAILDSLRELDWGPRELRQRAREVQEAGRRLTARLGRTPSQEELAAELQVTTTELQQTYSSLRGLEVVSLDAPLPGAEEEGLTLESELPAREEDALAACIRNQDAARVAAAIEELPERERTVLALYYYEELAMKDIAKVLGVVDSRVSQIHTAAIARLRKELAK